MNRLILGFAFASIALAQVANIDSGSATDQYFIGGIASTTVNPPPGIDPTSRYGNFSYLVPALSQTPYLVTFTWNDQVSTGPNQRLFKVTVNDQIVYDSFDIYAACGGINQQCTRAVIVVPTTGLIKIVFTTQKRNAIVSALSLAPIATQGPAGPPGPQGPPGVSSVQSIVVGDNRQFIATACPSGYTGLTLSDGSCLTVLPVPPSGVKGQ